MVAKLGRRSSSYGALSPTYDWKTVETKARAFLASREASSALARKLRGKKEVGYVEGPPTLNNQPHIGHVRGRAMKDAWYRYQTLRGVRIRFRAGWDTQGLPVELQAEKELGLSGNKLEALRSLGEEKLVKACKELVAKYERKWLEADSLLGLSLDHERAYLTYRDEYIEREWKYMEKAWNKGLLGEGYMVVPYCPGCLTSLSHAEASSEYEALDDPSLYYRVRAEDGAYLAVWTTMPFTLVTDELVGVKPEAEYAYVAVGDQTWVVGSDRLEAFAKETGVTIGQVLKRVSGKDLEGLRYEHPLLDLIPGLAALSEGGKIHRVVAEEFVDTSTGTGIVHIAPANGEDDFRVATARNLPVFSPLDDEVRFKREAGRFGGFFARDADGLVSQLLSERGSLVFEGRITHEYPTCWRSGHRLVWTARREYFYWLDRIRNDLVRAAEGVEYFYEPPRNRFLQFVKDSRPWCVSRERVWGAPLPVWVCGDCGEKTPAFSRAEIIRLASELPDGPGFELHRPWIDRVVLRCPKCGGKAHREPFVLDCWHNAGSSPFASFTNDEFRRLVPVEFLTEAMDQTRGWAYDLLVLNVLLTGKPRAPYKAFLFQGFVLDDKGRKMSKSLGNTVWGLDVLRQYSVDLVRLYILGKSSPIDSLNLDLKEMSGRPYQVLNTLYHLHVYLTQNGEVDGYDPSKHTLSWAKKRKLLTVVDRWLLAKLARATEAVSEAFESGKYNEVCRTLEDLTIAQLSQTYIRLVRAELWRDDPQGRGRRLAIYAVLGHALRFLDMLLHPVTPFMTEFLYQQTFEGGRWATPMLARGLGQGGKAGPGEKSERVVDLALSIEEACNSARTRAKLKRRWPLRNLLALVPEDTFKTARDAKPIVASLCNVKQVTVVSEVSSFPARLLLKPNRARIGALFKEKSRDILTSAKSLEGAPALVSYRTGAPIKVITAHGRIDVPSAAYELEVLPDEGYEVGEKGGVFVALNKLRDDELIAEGLVRDLSRRLQALRKERGFIPTEVLESAAIAGLENDETSMLEQMVKEIAFLVRVRKVEILKEKSEGRKWFEGDLDGRPVYLDVG